MSPQVELNSHSRIERELYLQKFAIDEHAIVAITDPSGVITYVNDKFCNISGYSREELLGRTHSIINSGEHDKAFFVNMWKTITRGQTWRGEVCNRAKDGSLYWVDTTIVPFKDEDDAITQYIAIRADITDRKEMEHELRRATREMEEFVYTVSHDLKSPLVTIEGFAGFASQSIEDGDPDMTVDCLSRISEAVVRMRANIDDLLDLSRIGHDALCRDMVDLRELVDELVAENEIQAGMAYAHIEVVGELPDVWCDRSRIKQLLANLISNALKYGVRPSEPARVRISAESASHGVTLRVTDNGPGIAAEFRERAFQLFQRLETTVAGTGVGLSIVKRIAEMHGGLVWVEETDGGGATFVVTVPTQQSASSVCCDSRSACHD